MKSDHAINPMRRPERCPCCGAGLAQDYNSRGKYRMFAYTCGAKGWHDEQTRFDREPLEQEILFVGDIDWDRACPKAMAYFVVHPARYAD